MRLHGRICTALGRLPSDVDGMRLRAARRLENYWNEWPPTHESAARLAAYAGTWKQPEAAKPPPKQLTEAEEIEQARASVNAAALMFGGVGGIAFERRPKPTTGG